MRLRDHYPIIVTAQKEESRDFWRRYLGFRTVFDSSYERKEPVTFKVTDVIPGWVEGLQLMNEGSKYTLYIPSTLAYGETGAPPSIPPNATLTFDVELIKVGEAAKAEEKPADAKTDAKPEEAKKEEAKK